MQSASAEGKDRPARSRRADGNRTVARIGIATVGIVAFYLGNGDVPAEEPASRVAFFESRIRPLLVEHCYECHNSLGMAEGGLALDWHNPLRKGGSSGPAIVPGKPDDSLLLKVVRHEIDDLEMPSGGPKLEAKAIADLERWVRDGAVDLRTKPPTENSLADATSWEAKFARRKQWWSFQPIRDPPLPEVEDESWSSHPVDRFVLAKLEARGLAPRPPADPATLVRRYYVTLIGLPPTPAEVQRWTARLDTPVVAERDAAIGELVDELLDSPHFGERWARHWMDWLRYAESHGSEGDPEIAGAWRYRDYLIRALNADVPYDQLVREHVAGDLLDEPRVDRELGLNESLIGTAHWRMVFHGFAPTDALDERVRFTDDQIDVFSKAFLGLTVSCARCHDHKFDAISQRDYYALFGILRSCRPGRAAIDLEERQKLNTDEIRRLKPRIRKVIADAWLGSITDLPERLASEDGPVTTADEPQHVLHALHVLRRDLAEDAPTAEFAAAWNRQIEPWQSGRGQRGTSNDGVVQRWRLADADDYAAWTRTGIGLPDEPLPPGEFTIAPEGQAALQGIYPAGAYSHAVSAKHAARLTSPDVTLDGGYELWVHATGADGASVRYVVHDYPRSGTVYPVTKLGDWRWQRYELSYWQGERIHVELATAADAPLLVENAPRSWFGVREIVLQRKGAPAPNVPREHVGPLFALAEKRPPQSPDALAELYREALASSIRAWGDGEATDADALFLAAALEQGLLPNDLDELPDVAPLVAEYRRLEAAIPVPSRVPSLEETTGREQPLYQRGDHRQPGDIIPRRFLEAIDATPYRGEGSGRRELAEDLLREDNPLVRRVIVNRIWRHAFGAGLVRTPDNFGRLGEKPSHSELLDWLARRFVRDGWSLKRLARLLVTSRTWQQDARPSPVASEIDPDNRLLSHAHLQRLEAEAIRDALLATTGVLDLRRYGPPVDGGSTRRSVYVRVRRNSLDPFLQTFDFPEPSSTTGRRDVTNVPAQSLLWINDPRVHELAEAWARRVLAGESAATDEKRVRSMFLTALGRPPTKTETERVLAFLEAAKAADAEVVARAGELRRRIGEHQDAVAEIVEPVRDQLLAKSEDAQPSLIAQTLRPLARWEFDGDARDRIGSAHGTLYGGARIENGALVLDGRRAHVVTAPLDVVLTEKTLEAWVRLKNTEQRGGGVLSVQTPNGAVFDAIVFGEKQPRQWLAGSDHFRRTTSFDGLRETEATEATVHLAVVYHKDGRVVAYRNGRPYGKPYRSDGPVTFAAGETVVSFGLRHLPQGGNKMLAGRIERAQIHGQALTAEEVRMSAESDGAFVSEREVLAALTPEQRQRHAEHVVAIRGLEKQLAELEPIPEGSDAARSWKKFALSMFALKEFVHLR